jgi:hypothetical protein
MAFALCLVGVCAGVLYCLIFVTQPMSKQAPNDAVLFELLKTVAVSMISIIGTLMAVGHGSNASALPSSIQNSVEPARPMVTPVTPVPRPPVRPLSTPPSPPPRPPVDDDDDPPFKGAKE